MTEIEGKGFTKRGNMDSNVQESSDSKAEFRKPSNDAANRKYRRRSPIGGSLSSSDGSPLREHSLSPAPSRKDGAKVYDDRRKKDDGRGYGRSQPGRNSESYKHSDRHSFRSYHRHDDHSRRDRHVDDYDGGYSKSSYRAGRDSRDNNNLDHSRGDTEHRSRDYLNDVDKYSRSKSDGSGHRGGDKDPSDRAGSGRRHSNTEGDKDGDRHRDVRGGRYGKTDHRSSGDQKNDRSRRDPKERDGERYSYEEKRRHDDRARYKGQHNREQEEHSDDTKGFSSKDQDSAAKKPKIFSLDSTGTGTDGTSEQAYVKDSDIDAAKIAAMKAAELVNRNLVGTGYMSTDQKKKLLWGSKKSTATEESAHRWDTTTFGDRERQEKFNKLMSLRLHWYLWPIVGREGRCKCGAQARQPRCGEAAGAASDGFGEAIHSWVASERWSNCWTRSLKFYFRYLLTCISVFCGIMLYFVKKLFCNTLNFHQMGICWSLIMTGKVARYLMLCRLSVLNMVPF